MWLSIIIVVVFTSIACKKLIYSYDTVLEKNNDHIAYDSWLSFYKDASIQEGRRLAGV